MSGQLTEQEGPRFGSNVFVPRDAVRDRGSHGMFDRQFPAADPWSWVSMHRRPVSVAAAAAGGIGALVATTRRR